MIDEKHNPFIFSFIIYLRMRVLNGNKGVKEEHGLRPVDFNCYREESNKIKGKNDTALSGFIRYWLQCS